MQIVQRQSPTGLTISTISRSARANITRLTARSAGLLVKGS